MAGEDSALASAAGSRSAGCSLPSSAFACVRGVVTPWGLSPPPQDVPPEDVAPEDTPPQDAPPEDTVAEDHPRLGVDDLVRQRAGVGGAAQRGEGSRGGVHGGRLRAG